MGIQLHRARRADRLVTGLGAVLRTPLPDPFATEIVAVPTRGVERWLAQSLSHVLGAAGEAAGDGVCAGIDFPSPERMVGQALFGVTGVDPREDPWHPRRAVWPLLSVVDSARQQRWAEPLWRYLARSADSPAADDSGAGRRFATTRHLAELLDSYAANRPQMIEHWIAGRDVDGNGNALPSEWGWQAELWRRLRAEIGSPSPAERLRTACQKLIMEPECSDLPGRVSVFGPTRLPYATLAVLSALARHRQIHLWLPHASPALWAAIAHALDDRDGFGHDLERDAMLPAAAGRRAADPTATIPQNRLLGYLGRDSREFQLSLAGLPADVQDHPLDDADQPPATLLSRLQSDLAADRPLSTPAAADRIGADDDSISVHAAHGPDRQVEVLRELLLGLLAEEPTLEPRDIIVMCPDIETYAPLISAAFGAQLTDEDDTAFAGHPGHQLRVRLADRSLRQLNPLLQVLAELFDLAESRVEASVVADLCATAPVATKFDFTDDDLHRLRELVERSGVRWGLDTADRQRFGMDGFAQNTWAAGLDRILLGVAMDEDGEHFLGTTLPMDDIDAGDVDLVGRLTEVVRRLRAVIDSFARPQPLRSWIQACRQALELMTAVSTSDNWQVGQAYGELARIAESAADRDELPLTRREARAVLADLFAGRPSRANFRTGTLTVATMMPMRSVPHRVVCLLGLDDGVFPRAGRLDGDDLLAADPWIGDRDRRSEDRQLLLDAIMSSTDRLMIIYSGADPRTNAEKPPSVPLGELLDVLDQTASAADGGPVRTQILHRHPLQPFDPRNFTSPRAFSFDPDALAGARALVRPREPAEPVFDIRPLPRYRLPELIQLTDLINFYNHPLRFLVRCRAGLSLYEDEPADLDTMPIELDPLQAWAIGDRMLRRRLSGVELDQLVGAEWRRGEVPPRAIGQRALAPVADNVAEVAERARPLLTAEPRTADVSAQLEVTDGAGGYTEHALVGTVAGVYGDQLITVQYSRLGPKHRLQSWIKLLAVTAGDPRPWQAITIGRGNAWNPPTSVLGPVSPQFARLVLADLVDLYRTGLGEPLALPMQTAAEYARIRQTKPDLPIRNLQGKLAKLFEQWDRDAAYRAFFGDEFGYQELIKVPAIDTEARGSLGEPSRFGTLARRVWHPLLLAEELS
ncbi:exodeoxyribonuclease V subunit gamma [Microlunatus elymi]|uniref:RecBCD enzyme subunit RecC n=1 Tax=Microlunatus elymi TaxID=2596828 RepID=A0A516PZ73_9ACTN|nr:exodeoxyribonuclease V subunit gamma [Microlunatus elymi]QDP96452.1 exodeoxyribonuclease V subunit gamma [Microlunatus elymi]